MIYTPYKTTVSLFSTERQGGEKGRNRVVDRREINIHYIYKICGHLFKLVDLVTSATPVADRRIKSTTQHCTVIGCHLYNESVCQISAPLELPRSTVSVVIVKWKCLWVTTAHPRSGRPHKLTERDHWVMKCVACKNHLSSFAAFTAEFRTASENNVSTRTVWELHEMGFHGRAAAHKPRITMRNATGWLEWCKTHCHWTGAVETSSLEWWITLHHLAVQQTYLGLADARITLPARMHNANCKVWWRRNNGMGLFFMVWARPLSFSEGKS